MIDYTRQLDLLHPDDWHFPVTLVGCGGIGSITSIVLAKAGCPRLRLYDPDVIEPHNIPNQLFPRYSIGHKKVAVCAEMIRVFSDCQVETRDCIFPDDQAPSGIIISAVDSMDTRLKLWQTLRYNTNVPLYIDSRLGAEAMEVFTIHPAHVNDITFYERHLFPSSAAMELPCTARSIIYTGFVIAGFIVSQLSKWLRKEELFRRVNFDLMTMTSVFCSP